MNVLELDKFPDTRESCFYGPPAEVVYTPLLTEANFLYLINLVRELQEEVVDLKYDLQER